MSTTPSTFEKLPSPYTVVGGGKTDPSRRLTRRLTLLLLNRRGRFYRGEILARLRDQEVDVLCVEGPGPSYDVEALAREFPKIRFLILREETSVGEAVNLGVEESRAPLVLVAWNDMQLPVPLVPEPVLVSLEQEPVLCSVPLLSSPAGETVPTIQVPTMIGKRLKVVPFPPEGRGMRSIFPFDYCGLYVRQSFRQCGGYDRWMSSSYWQKLDFGFRAFLWGETIRLEPRLQMTYSRESQPEDATADASYKLFYLKNLAVRFRGDSGVLPGKRVFRYLRRTDSGLFEALREFRDVQRWVHLNRYRFRTDARALIEQWEMPL